MAATIVDMLGHANLEAPAVSPCPPRLQRRWLVIGRGLEFLARHATVIMAAGVFVGLAWPALAGALAPLLLPAVLLLLAGALIRQDWRAVAVELRRPAGALAIYLWLVLATPAIMLAAVALTDPPPGLAVALVLAAASAPLISCIPLALLLGLDAALATVVTLAATMALPLVLPPLALGLIGLELEIGVGGFMLRLGALIGGALALAWAVRKIAGAARLAAWATRIDGFNVVLLLVFAVAIMDGVTAELIARPGFVLLYLGAAFAANIGLQLAGGLAFAWMGRLRAVTCGLLSGNRNLAVLIAALAGQVDFDILLFFAVGQFPIYILPAILQPLYRRLCRGA